MRSISVYMLAYGFSVAFVSGFGSTIQKEGQVSYRMGIWGKNEDGESSNWKEFENVVQTLEAESENGGLGGSLVILAVDNATVESCLYKGNSSGPKLYDLILGFKQLELHSGARFIVPHMPGDRMKSQGTDGMSRGNLKEGVSLGQSMLSFCPWHLSALDRNPHLKAWLLSTFGNDTEFLKPEDWFVRGSDICGDIKRKDKNFGLQTFAKEPSYGLPLQQLLPLLWKSFAKLGSNVTTQYI